ncbi:MAG TPA: peptidylprolyl isomerase [Spirochaetota bacterium]|nr:peptidylprolyl isomerase [Spirochaetota bacterium]
MKKAVCIGIMLMIAAAMGCKREGDILATYQGGDIKRGDLYEWLKERHFQKDSVVKTKKAQKEKLERIAIERIAALEAKKAGFDATDEFKAMADMAMEHQLTKLLYQKEIRDTAKFKEPIVRISHIYFKIRDARVEGAKREKLSEKDLAAELEAATQKAQGVIEQLKKGEKFDELAKKHSDDFSKKNGGDIGFRIAEMLPDNYAAAAFALKEDAYTVTPVRVYSEQPGKMPNGVYVIRVTAKKTLTDSNVEDIIDNKVEAARLKNRLLRKSAEDYLANLKKAPDVAVNTEKATSKNPADVIFKVGEVAFTVADLNRRIALYSKRFQGQKGGEVTEAQRRGLVDNILRMELLKRVAKQKGLEKDPDYIRGVAMKRDALLAAEFMKKLSTKDVTVSAAEIQDEYAQNKDKRYYQYVKKGKDREKVVQPLSAVKDRIEMVIKNKKMSVRMKEWTKEILKAYKFTIDESKLE